jgi:hypothetical protein
MAVTPHAELMPCHERCDVNKLHARPHAHEQWWGGYRVAVDVDLEEDGSGGVLAAEALEHGRHHPTRPTPHGVEVDHHLRCTPSS